MSLRRNMMYAFSSLIPTDTSKVYALNSTFDENRYYLNSLLHQSPKNGNIILNTFTDGTNHGVDVNKKIVFRKSTDKGVTFGAKTTLYDPTDGSTQPQDPSIGFDTNGRLHIFADCHDPAGVPGGSHEVRYMYSDDDGATVSTPVVLTLPSIGLATFRMYGRVIQCGSILLAPIYFLTEEGDFTNSARYVIRSTDFGATWTFIQIEYGTTYINETELLAINNTVVIAMSRNEVTKQFTMYKSTDAGLTWINVGDFGTGMTLTVAAPCRLHKFRLNNGTWACVMYFTNKGVNPEKIYAIYGRLDVGVDGGSGLFRRNTLTEVASNTDIIHYGDYCHYNNNMNAIGSWVRETNFPNDNELIYITAPATQYTTVFNLINPVTIYDALAGLELAVTRRGLVTNTTNDYGVVDSLGRVTTLKSIAPSPTGRDFTATAGGITLNNGIDFDGTKALSNNTSTTWNFMSYSGAGYTDVNYTLYFTTKIGTSSNPNATLGMLGNNGTSAGSRGMGLFYNDVSPRNNNLRFLITKGTAGLIIDFSNDDVVTPNTKVVVTLEVDLSQSVNNNKVKLYINGTLISTTVTSFLTTVASPPTYNLQIGACGNNTVPFVGTMYDVVIQNFIDLPSVRTSFINSLKAQEGI